MTSALHSAVFIIGATSGIGRGLAQRIHAQGHKVIASGRRQERLDELAKNHKGMMTCRFDLASISTLEKQVNDVFNDYPDIATVIIAAGTQTYGSLKEKDFPNPSDTQEEMNVNIVGPMILSQLIVPRFLKDPSRQTSLIFVGSGLGFVPSPRLASYCATKSALHSIAVSIRSDLHGTNVKIVEIIPPFTRTELGSSHEAKMMADFGDLARHIVPLELDELLDTTMKGLEEGKTEIAAGTAIPRAQAWRTAIQPMLDRTNAKG